jgi:hypothetical protein
MYIVHKLAPALFYRQGGETVPATQLRVLPEPPTFSGDSKPSVKEIRAACRAYAEAAAAGLPNPYPPKPRAKPKAKPPPAEGEAAAPKKRAPYSGG